MFGLTAQAPAPVAATPVVVVVNGSQAAAQSVATIDPVAVRQALQARQDAADKYNRAHAEYLAADAEYRNTYNSVYISEGGPEHLRKVAAEDAASDLRAARDVAEVARVTAEQAVRLAELGWRSAMAGAAAPEAGE